MSTHHRDVTCPICNCPMVYGRVDLSKPVRGRMAWSSQGEYAGSHGDAASAKKQPHRSETGDVEAFRCPNCSSILIGPDRWP